jgi:hypothetical protein
LLRHAHKPPLKTVANQIDSVLKPQSHAIPKPPGQSSGISLDMSKVEEKLAETAAVSVLLNNIFIEEQLQPTSTSTPLSSATQGCIAGIDAGTFSFMKVLASKIFWSREELEKLAFDHHLMLDGTLDTINDASFDHCGREFFQGEDPIEIDEDLAMEILRARSAAHFIPRLHRAT